MNSPNEILEWQCERCRAIYAEYVNGCPKCWFVGEVLAGVKLVRPAELSAPTPPQQEAATDEQKVKQVWPDAEANYWQGNGLYVVSENRNGRILGAGNCTTMAWAKAAASLIPAQPNAPEAKGEPADYRGQSFHASDCPCYAPGGEESDPPECGRYCHHCTCAQPVVAGGAELVAEIRRLRADEKQWREIRSYERET